MTVWPSGLRRWLQAPVRKGVGSNPTAVSSLQQSCVAVSPTTKLNQHFCQNVAHVVLSTSTQHNVKFKFPSTNRSQKKLCGSAILMFCTFPSYPSVTTIICLAWREKHDSLAEWSKALASGASPQGRGFEPHSCQLSAAKLCGRGPDH